MPRTILTIVSTLARGGPMKVLMSLVRHLDPLRYRSVVVTLSPESGDSLIEELGSLGVPVKQMRLSRAESFLSGARSLRRLVAEVNPDLVHTHGIRADILATSARLECPIVSTLHCDLFTDYGFTYGCGPGALMALCHFAALKRFNRVVAVSESVAEAAERSGVVAHVIPNGVDLNEYCIPSNSEPAETMRANLGWPSEVVIALHTGSLSSRKNPLDVVAGFCASELSKEGLLVFAGDGPLRAECEKAAGCASNIVFLGKRKDVPNLLKAADILISASSAEGLPMALLEGCATGIRVLTTGIPPHRTIQQIFPGQVQMFNRNNPASLRALLDGIPAGCRRQRFVPAPSALERISGYRMSREYQEQYSEVLRAADSARSGLRKVASCRSGSQY